MPERLCVVCEAASRKSGAGYGKKVVPQNWLQGTNI